MKIVQKNGITKEDGLFDIQDIVINEDLPREERIREYLKQIKNPYRFRYGDVVVEVEYSTEGVSIDDCLRGYLQGLMEKG